MLPLLALLGGGIALAGILLSTEESEQCNNFNNKKRKFENEIDYQNEKISEYLEDSRNHVDMARMKADRRYCINLGNEAFALYDDAKQSICNLSRCINNTKEMIKDKKYNKNLSNNATEKRTFKYEINELYKYLKNLSQTRSQLIFDKEEYYFKLKELNQNTAELRDAIEEIYS